MCKKVLVLVFFKFCKESMDINGRTDLWPKYVPCTQVVYIQFVVKNFEIKIYFSIPMIKINGHKSQKIIVIEKIKSNNIWFLKK